MSNGKFLLDVCTHEDANGMSAWSIFTETLLQEMRSRPRPRLGLADLILITLTNEYNAKNVVGTPYVEFDNCQDALAFMLKYGGNGPCNG